jgi:hypothetical protein
LRSREFSRKGHRLAGIDAYNDTSCVDDDIKNNGHFLWHLAVEWPARAACVSKIERNLIKDLLQVGTTWQFL